MLVLVIQDRLELSADVQRSGRSSVTAVSTVEALVPVTPRIAEYKTYAG
ncbi:hypothetical protein ACPF8X_26330 [Streptomyces sp. G35A]